jgi:hypothetical protein
MTMRFCCHAEKEKLLRTCSMLIVRSCSLVSSPQPGEESPADFGEYG